MSKELATTKKRQLPNVTMEGVTLLNGQFRNFGGKPTRFNADGGKRTFAVQLSPDMAHTMKNDGWNVKFLEPREEGDEGVYFLKVNVKFGKGRPPRCVIVTSRGRTNIPEEMVEMLDWVDIANVDLIVRAYHHDMNGGGVAAYLQSIYVTVQEDDLEKKYANVPELTGSVPLALEAAGDQDVDDDFIDVEDVYEGEGAPPWADA